MSNPNVFPRTQGDIDAEEAFNNSSWALIERMHDERRNPAGAVILHGALAEMRAESDEAMRPLLEEADHDLPFTQAS